LDETGSTRCVVLLDPVEQVAGEESVAARFEGISLAGGEDDRSALVRQIFACVAAVEQHYAGMRCQLGDRESAILELNLAIQTVAREIDERRLLCDGGAYGCDRGFRASQAEYPIAFTLQCCPNRDGISLCPAQFIPHVVVAEADADGDAGTTRWFWRRPNRRGYAAANANVEAKKHKKYRNRFHQMSQ